MRRAWNRKLRDNTALRGSRTFAIVVLASAAPVLGTIMLIVSSTKPDLFYKTFSPSVEDGILTLDWSTLYKLEEDCRKSATVPAAFVQPTIRLAGYMLSAHQRGASRREVTAFLLVPNLGHWLHPAHEDDGVFVRMSGTGKTLLRPRQAVWVQGRLSFSPTQERSEAPCLIDASTVDGGPIP